MKAAVGRKPVIKIAVVESDPLRFVGFRALFDSEPEFELISATLPEIGVLQGIDLILLGNRSGQNLFDVMASLKATRPDLRIIVTGSGIDVGRAHGRGFAGGGVHRGGNCCAS